MLVSFDVYFFDPAYKKFVDSNHICTDIICYRRTFLNLNWETNMNSVPIHLSNLLNFILLNFILTKLQNYGIIIRKT